MKVILRGAVEADIDREELSDALQELTWDELFGADEDAKCDEIIKKYGVELTISIVHSLMLALVKSGKAQIKVEYLKDGWSKWDKMGDPKITLTEKIDKTSRIFRDGTSCDLMSEHFSINFDDFV